MPPCCRPSGLPEGIKDMAPLLFTIFDENASPFLKANMAGVAEPATEEAKGAWAVLPFLSLRPFCV